MPTLYGQVPVTAVAQPLSATQVSKTTYIVRFPDTNTGKVYVGDVNVTPATGLPYSPGEILRYGTGGEVPGEQSDVRPDQVYVVGTPGDVVAWDARMGTSIITASGTVDSSSARKPKSTDGIQFVSINGNDASDGLSWGTAKQSLAAAHTALPTTGGLILMAPGAYNITANFPGSKNNVTLEGSGEGVTILNIVFPGTYATAPTSGVPAVSSPGTTLAGQQVMPANTAAVTLNVVSTANLPTTGTILVGGPADGYGNPDGKGYPYAVIAATSTTPTTISGTVTSGGGVTYVNGASVVLQATSGLSITGTSWKIRDLTIDGSYAVAGSGIYPLLTGANAADFVCERIRVLGFGHSANGPNWACTNIAAARGVWRDCRSPVLFSGASALDCVAEDNKIRVTSGVPNAIQASTGAARLTIRNNKIVNTVAFNAGAGTANGIRVVGTVTSTATTGAVAGVTQIPVTSAVGFTVGQYLFIGSPNIVTTPGNPGQWEVRQITAVDLVGNTVTARYPLHNAYASGVQVSALNVSNDNAICDNTIIGCGAAGISVISCCETKVTGNKVLNTGAVRPDTGNAIDAMIILGCLGCHIEDNTTSTQGGYGINLSGTKASPGSQFNEVIGNRVFNCGDPGITLQGTHDSTVKGNIVVGGPFGVVLGEAEAPAHRNVVSGNRFEDCDWFAVVIEASQNNIVSDNEFINCAWNANGARAQGDSVVMIFDSYFATMPGATGNRVTRNKMLRSIQSFNDSSYNIGSQQEFPFLTSVPPGGLIPKYFLRDTPLSGSGFSTTLTNAVNPPTGTLLVGDTSGFPAAGTVYFLAATSTSVNPITYWAASAVTYTSKDATHLIGCNGSGSWPAGTIIGDTAWPMKNTGYNESRDNQIAYIARRTLNQLAGTSTSTNDYLSSNSELIFDFETNGTVTGTGSAIATNADHTQNTLSSQVTTGTTNAATATYAAGFAAGWLGKLSTLADDAVFELDIRVTDANIGTLQFYFSQDGTITNAADSGLFRAADGILAKTTQIEPAASNWVTYRWRKGDMMLKGTATWANIADLLIVVTPKSGFATVVRFDNLVTVRAG